MKKKSLMPQLQASREDMKRIRAMAREYAGAKVRAKLYPRKRPTLMKQLQVKMDEYDTTGLVRYDEEAGKQVHPDDLAYVMRYVSDMYLIFILEHGIASIQDETTRHIAEDTLLRGKRCKELEQKYGIHECMIRRRKHEAIRFLSLLA